jgi:adenine-specific DNA methylase
MSSSQQLAFDLGEAAASGGRFPSTRYQGSKRKLADWIWHSISSLEFHTALDAFGGSGAVGYRLKQAGKKVTYNDHLRFNTLIGQALIENSHRTLTDRDIDGLLEQHPDTTYRWFISETFPDIYFTAEENRWLDIVTQNIPKQLDDPYQRALAYFALFQSCMIKRPYNLFHRKNLYIREAQVARSFGNKKTWDTPFEDHFRKFVREANRAVFDSGRDSRALNKDILDIEPDYDLVYLDPPYMSQNGVSVNYRDFYHFLEGLARYDEWPNMIDTASKHRRLTFQPSEWDDRASIMPVFEKVIQHFSGSILVISYRSDGIPAREELVAMLKKYKRTIVQAALPQQYALSRKTDSKEILLIGI